jgi:toxin ParE1/3/4
MRKLVYRPAARDDLEAIFAYVAVDDPRRASAIIEDIRARCRALREYPALGPIRSDLGEGLRIYPLPRRIVVVYRVTAQAIVIIRVFSGGQEYSLVF